MPSVLIVDDDLNTLENVRAYLSTGGFTTHESSDGESALRWALENHPDAIVLDVNLPGIDGFDVCRRLREMKVPSAVTMLTARTVENDRLRGLDDGADDYILKPYSPKELTARLRAVLRRTKPTNGAHDRILSAANVTIDNARRAVTVAGTDVDVTPTEFKLLRCLAQSPGIVISRSELVERVLGWDYEGLERTVDVHVMNLRKKLTARSATASIVAVTGVGYRLDFNHAS